MQLREGDSSNDGEVGDGDARGVEVVVSGGQDSQLQLRLEEWQQVVEGGQGGKDAPQALRASHVAIAGRGYQDLQDVGHGEVVAVQGSVHLSHSRALLGDSQLLEDVATDIVGEG